MGEVISLSDFKAGKVTFSPPKIAEPVKSARIPNIIKKSGNVEHFDYAMLMRRSLWSVMQAVLTEAATAGLPKDSVILINFKTDHDGVQMSKALKERHPKDITIMLDAWWEGLVVTTEGFEVTLNFSDVRERMIVPFDAVKSFQDSRVGFGVGFEQPEETPPEPSPLTA